MKDKEWVANIVNDYDEKMPVIPFRHERAVKERLQAIARARGMKLNKFMQWLVDDFLSREGFLHIKRELK